MSRTDKIFIAMISVTVLATLLRGVESAVQHRGWWALANGFVAGVMVSTLAWAATERR